MPVTAANLTRMKTSAVAIAILTVALSACGNAGVNGSNSGAVTQSSGSRASGFSVPANAVAAAASAEDTTDANTAAVAYCRQTGGQVEFRRAVYGTNGPNPLTLAGERGFCQYTAKDGSRIHILLITLYTKQPTLAALAYILKPPLGGNCTGNPASCYCSQLGGSDQFGGTTGAGGGWYLKNSIDQTLEACIFPDMSSIDSWGLTYHTNNIIRGINLTKVMRYKFKG